MDLISGGLHNLDAFSMMSRLDGPEKTDEHMPVQDNSLVEMFGG